MIAWFRLKCTFAFGKEVIWWSGRFSYSECWPCLYEMSIAVDDIDVVIKVESLSRYSTAALPNFELLAKLATLVVRQSPSSTLELMHLFLAIHIPVNSSHLSFAL
jgi:hypothetical protein